MQNFISTIKGLLPGIDRRKIAAPFVVEGKNFLMSVDGPVSGLGRRIIGYQTISNPTNVQTFKVIESHESYVCTNEGIFRFNTVSEKLDTLFLLAAPVLSEFPWSQTAVGNKIYFTRPDAGLIEYDVAADAWAIVSGGSIPPDIYACTESEGRLILLTATVSAWSAIGDGQDFTPSTVTGAGAQALTKLGRADPIPLGVQKVPDGYLTFLSTGIMKSQAIQAANPFRHTILSKEHAALNPFCFSLLDAKKVIFATKAGLFSTSGALPEIYEPLMSEYLHERVFPALDIVNNQNSIRLYATFARAWFIVSISMTQQDYAYNVAYLLNLRTQEWGSLNAAHTAFLDFETLTDNQRGFNFSLLTADGTISRFDSSVGVEEVPDLAYGLFYNKEPVDADAYTAATITHFTVRCNFRTVATTAMQVTSLFAAHAEIITYFSSAELFETEENSGYLGGSRLRDTQYTDYVTGVSAAPTWIDKVNVFLEGTTLVATGNGSWDKGAASTEMFAGDCAVEFTAGRGQEWFSSFPEEFACGLSSVNLDASNDTIEHSIVCVSVTGVYYALVRESGSYVGGINPLVGEETLRVERTGSVVKYKIDGVVVYTSLVPSTLPLLVDCVLSLGNYTTMVCRSPISTGFIVAGVQPQQPVFAPLDAQILVGLTRIFDENTADRLSYMTQLTINMLADAVGATYEDWFSLLEFPVDFEEDWMAAGDNEEIDWGGDPVLITQYVARVLSTLDGHTIDETQDATLALVRSVGLAKFYSCYSMGLFHSIQIDALNTGDNFDLKTLDETLNFGGRL